MKKAVSSFILLCVSFIIILFTVLFSKKIFIKKNNVEPVYAKSIQVVKNKNPIDIEEILKENIKNEISEEMFVEEKDLEYTTEYVNNDKLPKGTIQVLQEGRDGKQNIVTIKKYKNDELISEEIVANNLIKASVNRVVEIGIGAGVNNYKEKVR